jgi:hypothetical protein
MLFTLSPDYLYKELTAILMKAERREERKRPTVTSYSEVLYVLNTDLNNVFLSGGEYPLLFLFFIYLFFALALRPNAGHGLLILEVFLITHNDAPQSVGILWTSDHLVAETSI